MYSFSNKRDRTQLAVGVSKPYTYILGGDLSFIGLEFQGGKIDNFNFYGNQIMQNIFLDLQIKDMNLNCAFIENRMERIDFKGTKISGYCRDNIFIECEPNGIMP